MFRHIYFEIREGPKVGSLGYRGYRSSPVVFTFPFAKFMLANSGQITESFTVNGRIPATIYFLWIALLFLRPSQQFLNKVL